MYQFTIGLKNSTLSKINAKNYNMTLLEMRIAWIVLPYLLLILSLSIPLVSVGCVCAHNFKMCALLFIKYFTDLCI